MYVGIVDIISLIVYFIIENANKRIQIVEWTAAMLAIEFCKAYTGSVLQYTMPKATKEKKT